MKIIKNSVEKTIPKYLLDVANKIDFIEDESKKRLTINERFKLELSFYTSKLSPYEKELINVGDFERIVKEMLNGGSHRYVAYFNGVRAIIPQSLYFLYSGEVTTEHTNV